MQKIFLFISLLKTIDIEKKIFILKLDNSFIIFEELRINSLKIINPPSETR